MKLRTLYPLICLLFVVSSVLAEVPSDSLYSIKRIEHLFSTNPDLAMIGMDSLRRRCEKEGYNDFSRQRLDLLQCCAHLNKNEIRLGIFYAAEALTHARKAGDLGIELMALQMLCDGYDRQKNDRELSYYARQLLNLAPKGGKSSNWYEAMGLYFLASGVINGGDKQEGLRLLQAVLEKVKKNKSESQLFSLDVADRLSDLYKEAGDYQKSWSLLKEKLKELEKMRPEESAMDATGIRMTLLRFHSKLMGICQLLGKDEEAMDHYQQTLELYKIYPTLPDTPLCISRFLLNAGQYEEAEVFLTSLLEKQKATGDTLNRYSLEYTRMLASLFTQQERFREANEMNLQALLISDTLQVREEQKAMLELNAMYRSSEYEERIASQHKTIYYSRIYLAVLTFFLVLTVCFVGFYISKIRKQKKNNGRVVMPPPAEIDSTEINKIYDLIYQYVVTEKHYLDKNIDIAEVGRQCHVNKEFVNKVLSVKMNMTLLDFVNSHRIDHACTLLLDPENKTIEVVANESGFNTARTFLRQFKAKYKMSTSEFRRMSWDK